ncbi:hypothetical protein BDZ45DRAFT_742236 [Acephala macrosclerotiorum]|nr:hypothetical protein BDZ45DRAFT_742236 [Acephala macrosclerotiorum]
MLGIYNYVNSMKKNFIRPSLSGSESEYSSFHLFPLLPPELRRKIWQHALPEKIIEASICFRDGVWYTYSTKSQKKLDARKRPVLFSVNVESRELCLEQYVLFANTYIHSTLDVLFISWHHVVIRRPTFRGTFTPIEGQPLERFHNVVVTAAQNRQFDQRFGALIECLKSLGSPREITLGLNGPKLPQMFSDIRGFSTATGHQVIVLTWLNDKEDTAPEEPVQDQPKPKPKPKTLSEEVVNAMHLERERIEREGAPDFNFPNIKEGALFIYSGP